MQNSTWVRAKVSRRRVKLCHNKMLSSRCPEREVISAERSPPCESARARLRMYISACTTVRGTESNNLSWRVANEGTNVSVSARERSADNWLTSRRCRPGVIMLTNRRVRADSGGGKIYAGEEEGQARALAHSRKTDSSSSPLSHSLATYR